jgi:hypothetical protein
MGIVEMPRETDQRAFLFRGVTGNLLPIWREGSLVLDLEIGARLDS